MKKIFFFLIAVLIAEFLVINPARAQQYKLRQVNNMMGMKTESTIYVKGMRKRTEAAGIMGMGGSTTIEQCDLKRYIKINDKKKLYFIEPFSKETEEEIDEDAKPAAKIKPVTPPPAKTSQQNGGIVNMWYNITDTGERKKMYGFIARHVWTSQKIKPSADACTMKDSMVIKTDGWYIDLPQFNCPVQSRPSRAMMSSPNERPKPDCMDKFVNHRSGKGKLGFPLTETRTIKMGSGGAKTSEFETNIETLEFSTVKLDSMLFEIPIGYTEAKEESELQDKMDVNELMNQYKNKAKEMGEERTANPDQKKAGVIRIGVYEPKGSDQVQSAALQQHMVNSLMDGNIEAVAISSEEDAKKFKCDYTLASEFSKIKQASKVGGLLKAIKNADPNAASSYNIEVTQTLVKLLDGTTVLEPKPGGKYEGKIDAAAEKALDEGCQKVLKALK